MILPSILCLVCIGWMAALIWRRSALLALVSLLAWPVFAFACLRFWGDEYSDIRVPFAVFLPALWLAHTYA